MAAENGSIMRVSFWAIITLIIGVIGYLYICHAALDSRVVRVETTLPYMVESVKEIKSLVVDIRDDQIRRAKTEERNNRKNGR